MSAERGHARPFISDEEYSWLLASVFFVFQYNASFLSHPVEHEQVLVIPEGYNFVVQAEGAMKFERVQFFVLPGAQLTFVAESTITPSRRIEK